MGGFVALALKLVDIVNDILSVLGLFKLFPGIRLIKDCHPRSKVIEDPGLVMGDRASEKDGFNEKNYLKREDIDTVLEVNFSGPSPKDREHNIVVITGRHSSGKSRVVWEFIRSEVGAQFKDVYVPRLSTDGDKQDDKNAKKDDLRQEMARIKPTTLVVFDDLDNLLDMGYRNLTPESLLEILARINDRDQACIITLSNTMPNFKEVIDLLNSDSALGRNKTKRFLFLEIEDIKKGDETFLWCTANLPINRYSKVIGGYIPQLTRYTDVNIQRVVNEPAVVLFLASFIILKKFRNRFRVIEERIMLLYRTIRTKDLLEDLPADPDPERIRVLFDIGMLRRCSNGIEVEVDDDSLFDSFVFYCVTHGKSNSTSDKVIRKYLAESLTAERNQVIRLVEAEHGEDPAIYSRILTRSRYPELRSASTNWFIKKFFEYSKDDRGNLIPTSLKPEYASDYSRIAEIEFASSIIVGRAFDPIDSCNSFLDAGIKPNITLVNELVRASMDHKMPQEREEIKEYALSLKSDNEIEDDLYFCQVMEASEPDFDEERIKLALDLYDDSYETYTNPSTRDDEQLDNLENTMFCYRSRLVEKADSRERIVQYFSLLREYPELKPEKKAVRKLVFKISSKAGTAADPLLLLLAEELMAGTPSIIEEEVCNTGLLNIIDKCQDAQSGIDIYDRIAPTIESTMHPAFTLDYKMKEKFLNVMAIRLASKMKRLSLDDIQYKRILAILKERTQSAYQNNDFGVANKLYNIVLNNQPFHPVNNALDNLVGLYRDESWLSGKRDIDNLNSAFQNAIEPYKENLKKKRHSNGFVKKDDRCKRLQQIAFLFDALRKEGQIQADDRFKLFMFSIIEIIKFIDGSFPTNDIHDRIEFDDNVERLNETSLKRYERLWCQVIRLSDNPVIPVKAAEICLKLAKKDDYQMDTINHLMTAYCDSFPNNEDLKRILQALETMTFDAIPHSIHDYCHYLAFDIKTGSLQNEEQVITFIDRAWTRLQHINLPLREAEKADLLCAAINIRSFDLQQAIDIVNFAIEYDRRYRYRPTPILTLDVIIELTKKFRKEESDRNENPERWAANKDILIVYAEQIQDIIYSLDTVSYPDKDFVFGLIKNPIDGPLSDKYGRKDFIRIPMESDIPDIRRTALLKRIDENGRARCSKFEAVSFLYQELYYANSVILRDCRQREERLGNIGDYLDYILLILESMQAAGTTLDLTSVNEDRFLSVFRRTTRWMYYDNFFEGYLLGGYVPEDLVERWRITAADYGFAIRG